MPRTYNKQTYNHKQGHMKAASQVSLLPERHTGHRVRCLCLI